jgi:hypothetical protein
MSDFDSGEDCPLCVEPMDEADRAYRPCKCGFGVRYAVLCPIRAWFCQCFHQFCGDFGVTVVSGLSVLLAQDMQHGQWLVSRLPVAV